MDELPFDDPRDDADIEHLNRPALEDAVEAMRHAAFFHSSDIAEHSLTRTMHRADAFHPEFRDRVEAWLVKHAMRLGLCGFLFGYLGVGVWWGYYDVDSDPSQ